MRNIPENKPEEAIHTELERKMSTRHLRMISLGGVIGTGLFLSSGYIINQAGPLGAVIAYAIGAVIVYLVTLTLGELCVAIPESGSFHVYATRFIGPATGFTVAILYWLNWTVALGSEFTAAGLLMKRWFPQVPVWIWSVLFIVVIFMSNALSARFFAETEFWFSFVKVAAIVLFICVGGLAIFGILPITGYDHAPLFENFTKDGLFPNGFMPVFTMMLTVNFAFSGTEVVAVTSGEAKNPEKAIPKAIRTTLFRLVLFFIGSIVVMAALIPWQDAGVGESPFVLVLHSIGLPFAGDVMNFVVLMAVLSTANSGLYAATRMMWSLAKENVINRKIAATNKRGVPMRALCLSMVGGLLALLSSVTAASSVYLVLVSISGLSGIIVWISIAVCQIRFRKQWIASGHTAAELKYRTPGYPFVPWAALVTSTLSCVLVVFDPSQRRALLYMIPFIALCYAVYFIKQHLQKQDATNTSNNQ